MGPKGTSHYPHQNGGGPNRKANISPRPFPVKESNTPDVHAHDRLTFLLTAFIVSLSYRAWLKLDTELGIGIEYDNHHENRREIFRHLLRVFSRAERNRVCVENGTALFF